MTDESRLITLVIERDGRRDSYHGRHFGVYPKSSLIRFQQKTQSFTKY